MADKNPSTGPSFVYKSVPVSAGTQGMGVAAACAIADPAETAAAEMITMDGSFCHYGNSSTNSSTQLTTTASSWDVYIKPGTSVSTLQGDHGGHRLGFVDYNLVVQLSSRFCLEAANWAQIAEQLGKVLEL